MENISLSYEVYQTPEQHNNIARTRWRDLFRPLINVKALHVPEDLVEGISQSLQSKDEEPPLELLPNLQVVQYSGAWYPQYAFGAFINERKVAGYAVNLIRVRYL